MMLTPNCPDHERLVLDLALGRLDDTDAARAEDVRTTCPTCRTWWAAQFDSDACEQVDGAVAAVFDGLELPRRQTSRQWMGLAAALVMAAGATALWLTHEPLSVEPVPGDRVALAERIEIEAPAAAMPTLEPEVAPIETADRTGAIEAAPSEIPVADEVVVAEAPSVEAEPFFTGGFETGDFSEWVPST
jgi:hypothetical protein